MGKWIEVKEVKPRHSHNLPLLYHFDKELYGVDSVWECDCEDQFIVSVSQGIIGWKPYSWGAEVE
jgi:hypothetical protein